MGTKPTALFPQLFPVLPNSHDYFYDSIAARIALQTIFIYVYRLHADGGSCVTTWRQFFFVFLFFTRTFSVTGMAANFNFQIPFFDMLRKLVYVNHVSTTGFFTVEFDIDIDIEQRLGVSRKYSVRDKLTVLNVYIFRIFTEQ